LRWEPVEVGEPGPGEARVRHAAIGVNFIDTYHRSGLYPVEFPFVPGVEGSGTITAVGDGVDDLAVGDRVAWSGVPGSYAETQAVPATSAVPVPDGVDLEQAAAVILQGLTAHYLATSTFPLGDGDVCLVHAGAGGVGLLLTQIAKMRGARVITTVGSDAKVSLSRQAGADDVIVYTQTDFKKAVEELVGERAVDVVFDGVGAATFDKGIQLLRPRGMMVTFGNASGPVPEVAPLVLSQNGSLFLTRPTLADYVSTREELTGRTSDLFSWIAEGRLNVTIGDRYALGDAAEAHTALESRATTGKVLLIP
jgi:NADPH2:quinone reductase